MPKMKSNSAAKKRFTRTGSGKLKRHHARASHILTKKTRKMKRRLASSVICDPTNMGNLNKLLPYR
ncbi:50S ribosomal protein L35 [Myxococcota bacterium]|nr:50S ribosomal protein L35 [Myxococcota bacterium]MBU1534737.1 50S ribosomal protein L35 [Myxococcota bacterium]